MAHASKNDITCFFFGDDANAALHKRMSALYYNDATVRRHSKLEAVFLDRPRRYARAMQLAQRMMQLQQEHGLNEAEMAAMKQAANEAMPVTVHDTVYAAALRTWAAQLPAEFGAAANDASSWAVLGCYAQTELGHGSNVRGIETSATYVPDSGEFELHTPTAGAVKWWVGGLGRTATQAIVIARLLLPSGAGGLDDKGPHAFHIRIRDGATLMPLPGMTIGDIGPKMSFEAVDNGFLCFNCVRVPGASLIAVTGSVERTPLPGSASGWDVVYSPPSHPQAAYSGLVAARVGVVSAAYWCLAHAAVIIVRYSAARVQFAPTRGAAESPLLAYYSQQARVLPVLAAAVLFSRLGPALRATAATAFTTAGNGNLRALNDLHITASALKVYVTAYTADCLENARRCAGGAGYSHASGLPSLASTFLHLVTAEGDNFVLSAAVARHFIAAGVASTSETVGQALGGFEALTGPSRTARERLESALSKCSTATVAEAIGLATAAGEVMTHALLHVLHQLQETAALPDGVQRGGMLAHDATMLLGCAYATLAIARALHEFKAGKGDDDLATLTYVHVAEALRCMRSHAVPFCDWPCATALAAAGYNACTRLARVAVPVADALCIHDDALGSLLGRSTGLRYEDMLAWAQREPMNAPDAAGRAESEAAIRDVLRMGRAKVLRHGGGARM